MGAPVCHISPDEPITQPTPRYLPSIPQATDLQSALAAINSMRQILLSLLGQIPQNNLQRNGGSGTRTTQQQSGKKPDAGFREISRVVQTVRVYNPKDKSQYVDVERINRLVLRDPVTGASWVWSR